MPDGRLVGIAGTVSSFATMLAWLRIPTQERGAVPECQTTDADVSVLEVTLDGTVHLHQDVGSFVIDGQFAIGSGQDFALAAMACGKSAAAAVAIAARFDSGTGGKIDVLRL